jgi:hypothetical protein
MLVCFKVLLVEEVTQALVAKNFNCWTSNSKQLNKIAVFDKLEWKVC